MLFRSNVNPTTGTEEPVTTTDVVVPNVIGLTEVEARRQLSGLTVIVVTTSDASKQDGVVISQSFAANSVVEKNAKIKITINKKQAAEKPEEPTEPTEPTEPAEGGNTTVIEVP